MTRASESGSQATSLETSVTMVGPMRTSGVSDAGSVELGDLSRFEGEGGPEAPILELVDVPLDNAIWRRSRWAAYQPNRRYHAIKLNVEPTKDDCEDLASCAIKATLPSNQPDVSPKAAKQAKGGHFIDDFAACHVMDL